MEIQIKTAVASAVGTAHDDLGLPCQDYVSRMRRPPIFAIALADGAGSAEHSEAGARIVVKRMLKLLRSDFHHLLAAFQDSGETVNDHMVDLILTPLKRSLQRWAKINGTPIHSLASTLLFAATDGQQYFCGQLGDGRMAIFNRDISRAESVFEPVKGEFFNQTVFVTSPLAHTGLNLKSGVTNDVGGFAIMSDGTEESLFNRAEASFAPALLRMMKWLDVYPGSTVSRALTSNLNKVFHERTSDDLSIGLIRIQSGLPAARASPNQPGESDTPTDPAHSHKGN